MGLVAEAAPAYIGACVYLSHTGRGVGLANTGSYVSLGEVMHFLFSTLKTGMQEIIPNIECFPQQRML